MKAKILWFSLVFLSVIDNSFGNTTGTIFRKELPDGRLAIIERKNQIEHHVPTKNDQLKLPPDVIAVAGDVRVEHISLRICDRNGTDTLVWSKKFNFHVEPDPHEALPNDEFVAHDVVENGDQFAIIFSADSTDVEIIAKDKSGKYGVLSSNTIFRFSLRRDLIVAKLVWVDDVYAVLSFGPSAEIWRIREKSAVKVYSSTDRPLKNP